MLSCDHTSNNDTDYLASQVIEIYCGAGARVAYYDLEESSERTTRVSGLFVRQEQGSELTVNGSTLMGGTTRNDYEIDLAGERCADIACRHGDSIREAGDRQRIADKPRLPALPQRPAVQIRDRR